MSTNTIQIEKWGGIVRDDKSKIAGGAFNVEELDVYENADFVRPTQIMSADSMPAGTEIYSYTADNSDNVWGYGQETAGGKVRLVKVTTGGADNPGAFTTVKTSADATNLFNIASPIQYFRQDETGTNFIYYTTQASGTIRLARYDITNDTEDTYNGSAWVTKGTPDSNSQLTGLDGSYDRITMKVIFGELFITNGQYIAKVDKDGVFTEKAFTLPNGWEAVDIIEVSDVCIILARNINRLANEAKGFWWDLTSQLQVDDSFDLPMGGPQWIVNHKETIKILCAQNGQGRMYQLSGAFPGAIPVEIPGIKIDNVGSDGTTTPISSPKMVAKYNNILYFALKKTDKTGIYAIGQLDSDKPTAMVLAKRFATTDYSLHTPYSLLIQGPNFYAAYMDNATATSVRCETKNSPARSSQAVYESIILDGDDPTVNKTIERAYLTSYPLPASCSLDLYIDPDYSGTYTQVKRPDNTIFNSTNGLLGFFKPSAFKDKKVFRLKVLFTSNGTDAPKLTGIGLKYNTSDVEASK